MKKVINLVQFIGDTEASSAEDGIRLFEAIKELVQKDVTVCLDFDGLDHCVTRFLNPAIGQLYGVFDRNILNKFVMFKNVRASHVDKIKAVTSNAQNYYNDPNEYEKTMLDIV